MRIAIAQINPTVGDIQANEARIRVAYERAVGAGVDLLVCPELAVTGYPPRDLLHRPAFIEENLEALNRLAASTGKTGLLVGFVGRNESDKGRPLTNAAALLYRGAVQGVRTKSLLPTYDVFDEERYFEPSQGVVPLLFKGRRLGVTICEDIWTENALVDGLVDGRRSYSVDPTATLVAAGAEWIINLSASPWQVGKERLREELLVRLARRAECPVIYCNLVGGNDELIFDGQSMVLDHEGKILGRGAAFREDFVIVDVKPPAQPESSSGELGDTEVFKPPILVDGLARESDDDLPDEARLYRALVLGTRDFLHKCGFRTAVLGLSGGIDSALVACIAAAALGPENVQAVAMPSPFSSPGSLSDARTVAWTLGIRYSVLPIDGAFLSVKKALQPQFKGRAEDVAEENIQARLRGVFLMGLSNKFGSMLLTTGNKSELAVGYCTLYGDMCGGLAVISDVPKTWVYRLAAWINTEAVRNGRQPPMPPSIFAKPPSAELRPDQTDQDSLPPYETLDSILDAYVVRRLTPAEIISLGHDASAVHRVIQLIDRAEYKRRQAAPGLRVTSKAFGMGRRIPIAQRWRED